MKQTREIKFRAREIINNRWAKWDEIGIIVSKNADGVTFRPGWNDTRKEFEIQQFTGLKDKNGKEIYEGDIVKSGNLIQKVYYDSEEAAFKVKAINCHDEYGSFLRHWKGEVVGNIYETPELIPKDTHVSA